MTVPARPPVLSVVVCGAGPASHVTALTGQAIERGWDVQVVATPAALAFLDTAAIEAQAAVPSAASTARRDQPGRRFPT